MFGYVLCNRPELKVREYDRYRACYCGLCRTLKNEYGFFGRMTLNYDMTFLVMLLTGLYEPPCSEMERRCAAHPVHLHREIENPLVSYAAAMNVLMAYYNMIDDWKDEKKAVKLVLAGTLKNKVKKIEKDYEKKSLRIKELLKDLDNIEKSDKAGLEDGAVIFGHIMGEIFAIKDDMWKDRLYTCGFYLGKFIYLLDAYEDIKDDIKAGRYNPFREIYIDEDFHSHVEKILTLQMAECTKAFEMLPIITDDVEILRNILYTGVWLRFEKKREDENGSVQGTGRSEKCHR